MKRIRLALLAGTAAISAVLLSGCIVAPVGPGRPVYYRPAVVAPVYVPPVVIRPAPRYCGYRGCW
jgi:hypothetical protein